MKVTVAIPIVSFERVPLLSETIRSLRAGVYKDIHIAIVVDARPELYEVIKKKFATHDISVVLNKEHSYWVSSANRVWKEFDSDYYVYATDDITFPPACIANAVLVMEQYFSDGFGLVNLFRRAKATFGLFGRKFAEHFPDCQALCPDFMQYGADREITESALELGVYKPYSISRENQVKHRLRIKDETWNLTNGVAHKDSEMLRERREKGYKWGIDFNLIRK